MIRVTSAILKSRFSARRGGLLLYVISALTFLMATSGCDFGKGGGTETESDLVAGRAVNPDGSPAVGARVVLRPADYLADPVSAPEENSQKQETVTDAQGRFTLKELPAGAYRVELAGAESNGLILDFTLQTNKQGYVIPADTLRPRGSIMGTFAPDSEVQLARFVQVYGLERLVKADPSGAFLVGNLPPGKYDVRFSSLQPFRREAVREQIEVKSAQPTLVDSVPLAKEAKLSFTVDTAGLQIESMSSLNPVILDNERWDNGVENEYIWAKASLGILDLRGNIVTGDFRSSKPLTADQIKKCRAELRLAHLSGVVNIPDPVSGAEKILVMAPSGRIEDIAPVRTAGSDLIVSEARLATPENPLIVVCGGPVTTIANAYLTDPSIASRMVVAGIFTYSLQSNDTLADYLVARKCRFVQWGRTYSWTGALDTTRLGELPKNAMGDKMRSLFVNATHMPLGDLAPVAYLFNKRVWKSANMVKVSPNLAVQPASDITFDFLDIPAEANQWDLYKDEFFSTLGNADVYKPWFLPGRIEAEANLGYSGVAPAFIDSAAGTGELTGFGGGNWAEYKIAVASPGNFQATFHYRAPAGGSLTVGYSGQAPLAQADLPASSAWDSTVVALPLVIGNGVLRVTGTGAAFELDAFDIR